MRLDSLRLAAVGLELLSSGLASLVHGMSSASLALGPTAAKRWSREKRSWVAFLALTCAFLAGSGLPNARAAEAPTPDAASYATLRSVATDLARAIKATTRKPQDAGSVDAAKVEERAAAAAQDDFARISEATEPRKYQVASLGHTLYKLAADAPDVYRSLLADATIQSRLLEVERAFEVPFFADAQSNAGATVLLERMRDLAEDMTLEEPGTKAKEDDDDDDDRSSRDMIVNRQQLDVTLKGLGEVLGSARQIPVPRLLAPIALVEAAKFLHGRLISEAKTKEFDVAKDLIRQLGEGGRWQAHNLFRHFSTPDPGDAATAAGLAEILLQTTCKSAASGDYACLTTLSMLQLHYQTLQDRGLVMKTRARLDDAIQQNLKLRLALSQPSQQGKEGGREREDAVGQLLSLIPRLDDFGRGGVEDFYRKWNELQAVSYWLVKATAKSPKDLERVLSGQRRGMFSSGIEPAMIAVAAFMRGLALKDGQLALAAIAIVRNEAAQMAEGERSDDPELQQLKVQLDLMELMAWQVDGNLPRSRQTAQRIQSSIAPMLKQQWAAASASVMPTCPPPAKKDAFVVVGAGADFVEGVHSGVTQLQMQWDLKEGKRVALPLIHTVLAQDVRDLFRPRIALRRDFKDDDDEPPKPLSPAEFVIKWEELYRPALKGHIGETRRTAATVKCLLGLPALEPQLAADFVNKDSAGRAELARALYALLDDSGTLTGAPTRVADDDFRLLQLVSVLQAHQGISAAVARSAFPGDVREKVRQAEVGMAKLQRFTDTFQGMVNFVKIGGGEGGAMVSLLDIASAYPEAYAKYAELKQQNIAGLGEVTAALRSDEAAVLFSGAGEKLLAVVVRNSGGTVVPIKVPVSKLQANLSTLLASLRQPSDGASSLPSKFRADAAWTVYQQLFQPLEGQLAGVATVYLIGGELLSGLPFQTLLTAKPPPQATVDFSTYRRLKWLGDRFAFVSLPSMHSVKRLADKARQDAAARLWGVGEAEISGATLQAMKLSGIPDTGQLLAKASKGGDLQPLLRAEATYTNFAGQSRGGTLSKADIVLINSHTLPAGHGERFGTKDAAIVLAPSGENNRVGADLLTPTRVVELSMPVRLTMLLACETAGGAASHQTQPFAGLVNAFFFSGADTVLATAQSVNSAISEDLAVQFLRLMRDDGLSSAKALQRASAEVRCPDDASPCAAGSRYVWAHPAYWSQFMLVGSGR
jgi:CHAT domain-containing protein